MTSDKIMTALTVVGTMGGLVFLVAMAWSATPPEGASWAPWAITALAVVPAAMVVVLVADEWKQRP